MWASLPEEALETGSFRSRRVSRHRVKKLVRRDQRWLDSSERVWRVAKIHAEDGLVELSGKIAGTWVRAFPTFGELARGYELMDESGD